MKERKKERKSDRERQRVTDRIKEIKSLRLRAEMES